MLQYNIPTWNYFFNSIVINTKIDIFKLVLAINLDMAAAAGRRGALL